MRKIFEPIAIPAGKCWPQAGDVGVELPPFSWIHVENRGANGNDAYVSLGSVLAAIDITEGNYWRRIAAQTSRTMNCAGNKKEDPQAKKLFIFNNGAAAITVHVEVSDTPIVDIPGPTTV